MYKRMLVPLDGSQLAEAALSYAAQLANRLNLGVTLLHVCGASESAPLFMCRSYVEHEAELIALKLKSPAKEETRGEAITGNAAEGILAYAEQDQSDLILMAAHGESGGRWLLGSVAHKVLSHSKAPVLLVRTGFEVGDEAWPKVIIVPLDGSSVAESILAHVEMLAGAPDASAEVVLLRVCQSPALLADYPEAIMPHTWEEHVDLATKGARQSCGLYLGGIRKSLENRGIRVQSEVVLGAEPADAIIKYAGRHPFGLIAMSTHGESGITRWPYGHVGDRVLLSTKNPLLFARPQK